jgi:REP element-mobilizing transposase RayT
MTQARKRLVSYSDTPYYHCVSRCVRRAFLCGRDPVTGFDFEHRRGWIVKRMQFLSSIFAIDLCAYAVMSNHYHVVVRVNIDQNAVWSDQEVAERWCRLFSGSELVQRWMSGMSMDRAEYSRVRIEIEQWRDRLQSLSWFMRCLNEYIARMANREDSCTGRFWEGRFKSQALLDEKALLSCMAYVDLNPIRAGLARTLEQSDFTSIQQRIQHSDSQSLRPFSGQGNHEDGIPYTLKNYLQLVDWAGRAMCSDKPGYIPEDTPPILKRLGIAPIEVTNFLANQQDFPRAIGPLEQLRQLATTLGGSFFKGTAISKRLYTNPS